MITLFLNWQTGTDPTARVSEAEQSQLATLLQPITGLARALLHTAAAVHDPYLNDGPSPPLALQLYFADIGDLEAACATNGPLQAFTRGNLFPSLAGAEITQQAMLARSYPVDEPNAPDAAACTYLVCYPGPAENLNAWLTTYIAHHPGIMRRFPAIRGIEIYTRLDWCSELAIPRADSMQRNKVVFDSPAALNAALNSPVRDEMRRDFHHLPAFSGGNTHFPMLTRTITPWPN